MTKWFTADTHYSHDNIIALTGRPFSSADEMNEVLITRWNDVVRPGDFVYHLGDVALGKIADSLPLVSRLNGFKILLPGNHDRIWSGNKQKQIERFTPGYRAVFQSIWPETSMIALGGHPVMLSHFPFVGDSQEEDRHVSHRPTDIGTPLLHGHIHDTRRIEGRMFNVGVDVNGFQPVHEDVIIDWIEAHEPAS